jgi:chemotaxis protein methyltransferase CheR
MAISDADFHYIRDFLYKQAAIVLDDGKGYLIESRLQPLAKRHGFSSLQAMVSQLRAQPQNGIHVDVVEAMTTNETYFFRDVYPFEALKKNVLPELIKKRESARQLNIWCAATSSGQEVYTILMLLKESFPSLASWKINFVASDISKEMLDRCREGCYSQLEVNRGLAAPMLVKYFQKIGVQWQIKEELRRMVDWRQINLAQNWGVLAPLDIVFMRNVLIYFDLETKRSIFGRLSKLLKSDGYLFLGGAETTMGIDDSFKRVAVEKTSYYQIAAA